MVSIRPIARDSLRSVIRGLASWGNMPNGKVLTMEHILSYHDKLEAELYKIPLLSYHTRATYRTHTRYGTYVHKYKTNSRTTWYIVYNKYDDDYIIEYITNNYNTISGTLS